MISEDLASINYNRTIEHHVLDNMQILYELSSLDMLNRTESEEKFSGKKITVVDTPVMISVKVLDPGQILLGKLQDQSRNSLELKKLVDFSGEAFTQLYRIAPVETWAIFAEREYENVAQRLLESFGQ